MKPLAQMTHEELYAMDEDELAELLASYPEYMMLLSAQTIIMVRGRGVVKDFLHQRILELQQSAAEARLDNER